MPDHTQVTVVILHAILGYYIYAKNLKTLEVSLEDIDEQKKSCNLIGREHDLVYNLQFCLKLMKKSFNLLTNQPIFRSELFFSWECP